MPRLSPITSALALALVAGSVTACGESYDLSTRFRIGEEKRVRFSSEIEGGHRSGSTGNLSRAEFTLKRTTLEAVPRSDALVRMDFERVLLSIRRGKEGEEESYDSAAPPPGDDASTLVKSMATAGRFVGQRFDLRIRPDGKIASFEGIESLRERLTAGLEESNPVCRQLLKMTERLPMHHQFATPAPIPARSHAVGSTWSFADILLLPETIGVPGMLYLKGTATLRAVENGVARIDLAGTVYLDPPDPGAPPLHPDLVQFRRMLRMDSGEMKGHASMRIADGELLEAVQVFDLDIKFVKVGGAGEVPVATAMTRRYEVLEDDAK